MYVPITHATSSVLMRTHTRVCTKHTHMQTHALPPPSLVDQVGLSQVCGQRAQLLVGGQAAATAAAAAGAATAAFVSLVAGRRAQRALLKHLQGSTTVAVHQYRTRLMRDMSRTVPSTVQAVAK